MSSPVRVQGERGKRVNGLKILVVKLSSLGDVLQTTHVLNPLASLGQVDFLVAESCRDMVSHNPQLREILTTRDLGGGRGIGPRLADLGSVINLARRLRARSYDVALIFHRNIIFALLAMLAGIPRRIGFYYGRLNPFLTDNVLFDLSMHRLQRNWELVAALNPLHEPNYRMELGVGVQERVKNWLQEFCQPENPLVALAPGGGKNLWAEMPSRRWNSNSFAQLGDLLQQSYHCQVVLVGGAGDVEIAKAVERYMKCPTLNLAGKLTLLETAYLLEKCKVVVGNDSAPLFIAAAVNTPTVGIFGPTDGSKINPFGRAHLYVQGKIECTPCYNPVLSTGSQSYRCVNPECMFSVKVEEVLEKVRQLLALNEGNSYG